MLSVARTDPDVPPRRKQSSPKVSRRNGKNPPGAPNFEKNERCGRSPDVFNQLKSTVT